MESTCPDGIEAYALPSSELKKYWMEGSHREEKFDRSCLLGQQSPRRLRSRNRRPDVPQGVGWQPMVALADGLGIPGRPFQQPTGGRLLGQQPPRYLRPWHRQPDVPQGMGWHPVAT